MSTKPFGKLFLNAGAMKSATTWIHGAMRQHPQLHFTPEKEIHYFHRKYIGAALLTDNHRINQVRNHYALGLRNPDMTIEQMRRFIRWINTYLRSPMDDQWYSDVVRPHDKNQWSCDFSNLYAQLPQTAWSDIAESCEDLRVLYVMRDPLHRLWSHLKFDLKFNGKLEELPSWTLQQVEQHIRQPGIWINAEYGEVVRRMKAGLDPKTVKFVFMPEQHTDALGFLQEIERFVGLSPIEYQMGILKRKVNQSDPAPMPPYFADLFRTDVERIKDEMRACGVNPPDYWL